MSVESHLLLAKIDCDCYYGRLLQMVGEKQSELQVSSIQLLYYQAPLSSLLLIIAIPFFDSIDAYHGVLDSWPLETLVSISVSLDPFHQ